MERFVDDKAFVSHAVEASIHIGLVVLLVAACFLILRPFIVLISWGIILAIALYPGYRKLQLALGGREVLSAVLLTLLLLALLIVPVVLLAGTLVQGIQAFLTRFKDGTLAIPPPPVSVETWPLIGVPLKRVWSMASTNLISVIKSLATQIKAGVPWLLAASSGIGLAVLQFALSIVVAGILLANARGGAEAAHSLASRLFGNKGAEFEQLAGSTIRSVTTGILGVALIQSVLAGLGFLVAGLPGAGLWAIIFLIAAVLQVGALTLVPAVIYMFTISSGVKAVVFMIWCIIVALSDNVLKPILLGRGVPVPIAVVFLGAIGGFIAMGIIGLFVGAIALSVGYTLFLGWLERGPASHQEN